MIWWISLLLRYFLTTTGRVSSVFQRRYFFSAMVRALCPFFTVFFIPQTQASQAAPAWRTAAVLGIGGGLTRRHDHERRVERKIHGGDRPPREPRAKQQRSPVNAGVARQQKR